GYLYVPSKELRDEIQPWNAGWINLARRSGFRNLLHATGEPAEDATRFEVASPPYGILVPWRVSLDLLAEIGAESVEARVLALARKLDEGLRALAPGAGGTQGLHVITFGATRSGIVAFGVADGKILPFYRKLAARGITVAIREGAIRVSPHV